MDLTQIPRTTDYIGVGIGSYNLGIVALTTPVPGLVGQSFQVSHLHYSFLARIGQEG
jgi:hypothetical protein